MKPKMPKDMTPIHKPWKTKGYAYCEQCGQRIEKIEYVVNGCVCNACFDVNNELD